MFIAEMAIILDEARTYMDKIRKVYEVSKNKEEIVFEVGQIIWQASGLIIIGAGGEIIPNPKILGSNHGIEPLPFCIKITRRKPKS